MSGPRTGFDAEAEWKNLIIPPAVNLTPSVQLADYSLYCKILISLLLSYEWNIVAILVITEWTALQYPLEYKCYNILISVDITDNFQSLKLKILQHHVEL